MFFYFDITLLLEIFIAFFLFLFLICIPRYKLKAKAKELHNAIMKEREIVHEGRFVINHKAGFLFLTKKSLEFYYNNNNNKNFYLLLQDIANVSISGDFFFGYKITINTATEDVIFYHNKAKYLKENIEKFAYSTVI